MKISLFGDWDFNRSLLNRAWQEIYNPGKSQGLVALQPDFHRSKQKVTEHVIFRREFIVLLCLLI